MMQKKQLIDKAFETMEHAYAPYSKYKVGAAIQLKDGTVIVGANVENASFGATSCAERNAIFQVYSQGYQKEDIVEIGIVSSGEILAGPCGICRQVLSELIGADVPIHLSNGKAEKTTTMWELLPMAFGPKDVLK